MATNTVTTVWKENMLFESDNPSGETLSIDAPEEGIENKGLRPKALMLSSLAGCSGLDIVSLLKKMRAEVDDFKMIVHGELTDVHPKYYNKVVVEYHFYGSDLNENKINKAVNLSVETYCGVMEMFRQFADVTTEVYLHEQ
ncbi:OsmC family protein [Pseudotenacibaculum sp. MALMAid0570]|uniref:OsmC family protein n=1 Tax=Pseudotenacibaculum sp. MALMAid0570 TaxID=3143938 RepID=UPI0032DFEBF1